MDMLCHLQREQVNYIHVHVHVHTCTYLKLLYYVCIYRRTCTCTCTMYISCVVYTCCTYMYMYIHVYCPLLVVHTGTMSLGRGDSSLPRLSRPSLPLSGHRYWCRLRRAACLLYQSEPLAIVHARLKVCVLCT